MKLYTYSILKFTGNSAEDFLNKQLTCEVKHLTCAANNATYGAYCNVSGKVMCFFELWRLNENFFMKMPTNVAAIIQQEFYKYAKFSRVTVDLILNTHYNSSYAEFLQVKAKIPEVYLPTIAKFWPHDLNLPQISAVSFTKGCYLGQEIIARMEYRGTIKRQLSLVELNKDKKCFKAGQSIEYDNKAGTIVRVACNFNDINEVVPETCLALVVERN